MTVDQEARKKAILAIRHQKRHHRPTHFNPHYEIKGRSAADAELSSKLGNTARSRGPQFKTLQWEATARKLGLNTTRRALDRAEQSLSC